jgi:hypothetical protein
LHALVVGVTRLPNEHVQAPPVVPLHAQSPAAVAAQLHVPPPGYAVSAQHVAAGTEDSPHGSPEYAACAAAPALLDPFTVQLQTSGTPSAPLAPATASAQATAEDVEACAPVLTTPASSPPDPPESFA